MLKIWGRANSINVQKVLWCCGELGLCFERINAGNEFGVTNTPAYRAMNPTGLVPTIEDGDFRLWESNVIVRYLARKDEKRRVYPSDIHSRFDAERWMDWQATLLWPALRPLFVQLIRTPGLKAATRRLSRGRKSSPYWPSRRSTHSFRTAAIWPVTYSRWAIFLLARQSIAGTNSTFIILSFRIRGDGMRRFSNAKPFKQ